MCSQVKDFKWHRAQRSPNWSTCLEAIAAADTLEAAVEDTGRAKAIALADRCRAQMLWKAPPAAACIGFANALTPAPATVAVPLATPATTSTTAGGDDDEDEL